MDYVQVNDKLSAVLLSNRCAAYLNLKKYEDALEDAERCVQVEPDWSKVQYLFLSCFFFVLAWKSWKSRHRCAVLLM